MDESLIKSFTDLEQSRKLALILPLESADMFYYKDPVIKEANPRVMNYSQVPELQSMYYSPCWSLASLLNILPILERKGYQKAKPVLLYNTTINKWIIDSHIYTTDAYDNQIDACYEMVLKLKELNLL